MRDYKLRKKVFNDYLDTSKLPTKTDAMTSPVGVDADGNLWAEGSTPTGTINITQNGVTDVTNYASANVNVSGGQVPILSTIHIVNNYARAIKVSHFHYQEDPSSGDTVLGFTQGDQINNGETGDVNGGFWSLKSTGKGTYAFLLITATGPAVNVPASTITAPSGVTVKVLGTPMGGTVQSSLVQISGKSTVGDFVTITVSTSESAS